MKSGSKKIELSQFIRVLNDDNETREQKTERILNFCLDYLNRNYPESWEQKKNRALMLRSFADYEMKQVQDILFEQMISHIKNEPERTQLAFRQWWNMNA